MKVKPLTRALQTARPIFQLGKLSQSKPAADPGLLLDPATFGGGDLVRPQQGDGPPPISPDRESPGGFQMAFLPLLLPCQEGLGGHRAV